MTDFSTLWDYAGDTAEREAADRAMHYAVAQVAPVSEFLFQASSDADLANRLALAGDRFTKAAAAHGVEEEALVEHFRREASLVLEAKASAAKEAAGGSVWKNKFEVGDIVQRDGENFTRKITRITPPGAAGTSHADGPVYHASVIHEDGKPGHTADVWSKSMSNPTSAYKKVGSRKEGNADHSDLFLNGYHEGHADVRRQQSADRGYHMKSRYPVANPYSYGTESHAGWARGAGEARSGMQPSLPQPSWDDEGFQFHDDDDPSLLGPMGRQGSTQQDHLAAIKRALEEGQNPLEWLPAEDGGEGQAEQPSVSGNEEFNEGNYVSSGTEPKEGNRKAARALQPGDVISARATFRGEPLAKEAVVAQVAQDAIEPGWVRINTQDGRVLRTPKVASVVLAPKA